jgi:hypothetical protein
LLPKEKDWEQKDWPGLELSRGIIYKGKVIPFLKLSKDDLRKRISSS